MAVVACAIYSCLNGVLIGYGVFASSAQSFDFLQAFNFFFYGLCSFFVYRGSRIAAAAALAVYVANYTVQLMWHGRLGGVLPLLFGFAFLGGVYGTFARKEQAN